MVLYSEHGTLRDKGLSAMSVAPSCKLRRDRRRGS